MSDENKTETEKTEAQAPAEAAAPAVQPAPLKGLVGTKVGMTRIFVDDTRMLPVTVVSADGIVVSQVKTKEKDGYTAVQVAYGDVLEKKLTKPELGHFAKKGLKPKRHVHEFRVDDVSAFQVGQPVLASTFQAGDRVVVSGVNKGKGFTGAMKRFGFHGGPHSHGHGEYRRAPGSSGGQGPQRVLKGTRKPGHKGAVWSTVQNAQVAAVDTERNLIMIEGSVPGPNGNFIVIRPSTRKGAATAQAPAKKKK